MATELTSATKKSLNKQTRDENIRISEQRGRKKDNKKASKKITREAVERVRKPKITKSIKKEMPFLVLKEQEQLLVEKDDTLVEAINKSYITEAGFGNGLTKKGDYKRTSLKFTHVYYCPREVYYEFFEPERARKYTAKGLILFDEGKRHHKNLQRRLEDMGVIRGSEGYLHIEEINANGFYDGLVPIERESNDWLICDLLEIKSKNPSACSSVNQRDYDQAQLYHVGAQQSPALKVKKIKVRNIRILYRDRAIQTDEVDFGWIAKPDLDRQKDIMEYMKFLWNKVAGENFLSPHPHEKKSTKCTYCLYKDWCWREYPDVVEEPEFDPDEITLPEEEILLSYAKKLYEILNQEAGLRAEKKKLEPIILHYFLKMKKGLLPVTITEGLAPKQGKRSVWDEKALRADIGDKMFADISKPDSKKITDLIHRHFVDAGKFEKYKKYKLNKPSIYIKKIIGGIDAD